MALHVWRGICKIPIVNNWLPMATAGAVLYNFSGTAFLNACMGMMK